MRCGGEGVALFMLLDRGEVVEMECECYSITKWRIAFLMQGHAQVVESSLAILPRLYHT